MHGSHAKFSKSHRHGSFFHYLFGFMCMALMISLTVKLVIIKDIIKLVQGKIDD